LAPNFLPLVRETKQPIRAEIENHPMIVRGGRGRGRVAEGMGLFNFLGGNIAAPNQLAGSAVIRSTLQSVSLKRAQKNAFAPDAGRGMTRRDFSRPNRVFRRTESDWR